MEETKTPSKLKGKEIEKLVVTLGKEGNSPSKIGIILRDKHAIPTTKTIGKKISQILRENEIQPREDIDVAKDKIENLKKHIENNKHDYKSKLSLTKNMWAVEKHRRRKK